MFTVSKLMPGYCHKLNDCKRRWGVLRRIRGRMGGEDELHPTSAATSLPWRLVSCGCWKKSPKTCCLNIMELSQYWRPKVQIQYHRLKPMCVCQGHTPWGGSGETPFPASSTFQWLHHSNLCLCGHGAFSPRPVSKLSVPPFSEDSCDCIEGPLG